MAALEIIKELCEEKGVTIKKMEQDIGISANSSFKWKARTPSAENLLKLSEYFGVSTDYILTGEKSGISKERLHADPEIVELVNKVAKIPEAKVFLSAIKDMPKEDLETITSIVKKMTGNR